MLFSDDPFLFLQKPVPRRPSMGLLLLQLLLGHNALRLVGSDDLQPHLDEPPHLPLRLE